MTNGRRWAIGLAAIALVGVACSAGSNSSVTGNASESGESEEAASEEAETIGTVPPSLVTIEGATEDIIDMVPSGGWDQVTADVNEISDAWSSYQSQAEVDRAGQALVDEFSEGLGSLKVAQDERRSWDTMQMANNLSATTVELYGLYEVTVPIDVGRLDVLGRQVVLDVTKPNWPAANATVRDLKNTWQEIKPSILDHDGKDVAKQFNATVDSLDNALAARDGESTTVQATIALEIVDAMEGLY
jgi:hypothetical protein